MTRSGTPNTSLGLDRHLYAAETSLRRRGNRVISEKGHLVTPRYLR
jgi:hypothetical protein